MVDLLLATAPHRHHLARPPSLRYGYVHYFVFAAAGAFSAGIEVEIDVLSHHSELSEVAASFTVTVPIAIFVLGTWWLAIRSNADRVVNVASPPGPSWSCSTRSSRSRSP